MTKIDEYGKWQIKEGDGCINKIIVEPTELYLKENLNHFEDTKSIEERIEEMAQQLINAQEALDFLIMGGM
jgi:hypothetical protein